MLDFSRSPTTIRAMTEYGKFVALIPTSLLSHCHGKAANAARKKLLEQVEQRRRENYERF
jgi:hypothetical protein